jgi:hypothetical protein
MGELAVDLESAILGGKKAQRDLRHEHLVGCPTLNRKSPSEGEKGHASQY